MRKTFLIISSLLILLLPFTYIPETNETQANPILKPGIKAVQKVAKKQIIFYVDKRTVELRNEMLKREAIDELKHGIQKRKGYKTMKVRNRTGNRPIHKDRNVHYQIKEKLTQKDEKRLNEAIEKKVEEKLTNGRRWTLLENVADWLISYKFWVSLPTTIPLLLSGDAAQEIEDIAIDAMLESGILIPANPAPNETNYNSNEYFHHSGSSWNSESNETFEDWANKLETPIIMPIDRDITINGIRKINLQNARNYFNTRFIIDGFQDIQFDDQEYSMISIGISGVNTDEDYKAYIPFSIESYDLGYEKGTSIYILHDDETNEEDLYIYKNGKKLNEKDYLYDYGMIEFENYLSLNELEKIEFTFTNVSRETRVKLYLTNDIYEFVYNGVYDEYSNIIEFIQIYLEGVVYNPSEIDFEEILENINVTTIDMKPIETITLRQPFTYDIETDVPEVIHLPGTQYFPIYDDKGNELEIIGNEQDEPILVERETGKPVPDTTPIEVQDPIVPVPQPEPNAPPLNEEPIDTETPTNPGFPDPQYPPIPEPGQPQTPGEDGGIIPPFPEGTVCGEIDLDLKTIDLFTTKFPFSLPFDIYNAIQALFGKMGENPPEFSYKIMETEIEIKIPNFILDSQKFIRSIILFIFDVSMIYALYRLFGGAS